MHVKFIRYISEQLVTGMVQEMFVTQAKMVLEALQFTHVSLKVILQPR